MSIYLRPPPVPEKEPPPPVAASRGRLLLSLYLDFVVFSALWKLSHVALTEPFAQWAASLSVTAMAFLLVEIAFHRAFHWSVGDFLLSIRRTTFKTARVDGTIVQRESWFTLLVATLLLLEGSKGLVRWSMWAPPMPFFGVHLPDPAAYLIMIASGAIECYLAFLLFRGRSLVVAIGTAFFLTHGLSIVLSADLLPEWASAYIRQQRAYTGRIATSQEIAFFRNSAFMIALGGLILYTSLLLLTLPRLLRKLPGTSQGPLGANRLV